MSSGGLRAQVGKILDQYDQSKNFLKRIQKGFSETKTVMDTLRDIFNESRSGDLNADQIAKMHYQIDQVGSLDLSSAKQKALGELRAILPKAPSPEIERPQETKVDLPRVDPKEVFQKFSEIQASDSPEVKAAKRFLTDVDLITQEPFFSSDLRADGMPFVPDLSRFVQDQQGIIFEREGFEEWVGRMGTHPVTREENPEVQPLKLDSKTLKTGIGLKKLQDPDLLKVLSPESLSSSEKILKLASASPELLKPDKVEKLEAWANSLEADESKKSLMGGAPVFANSSGISSRIPLVVPLAESGSKHIKGLDL